MPLTFNHGVEGSNPSALTKKSNKTSILRTWRGAFPFPHFRVRTMSGFARSRKKPAVTDRRPYRSDSQGDQMSMMTTTEILGAMVAEDGHVEVLRGPTAEYITVCRPDGRALLEGGLPRSMLDDLVAASFVRQDGSQREARYRLSAHPRRENEGQKERPAGVTGGLQVSVKHWSPSRSPNNLGRPLRYQPVDSFGSADPCEPSIDRALDVLRAPRLLITKMLSSARRPACVLGAVPTTTWAHWNMFAPAAFKGR